MALGLLILLKIKLMTGLQRMHHHTGKYIDTIMNYESWIGGSLGGDMNENKALFMNKLRNVKVAIRTGTLPSKIFEKIDKQWKGI
ncbi:hypothetical protein [Pseudoalteromonas sp. SG43-7]|uniref:hypothetical protein n=1 Tax=Pseudoalteromonas sp. SG43-7 TaxID=2760966 RepID=UPI0028738398|nr:hypothetical protein [Pseudoalteromonas sp. SG43-7]